MAEQWQLDDFGALDSGEFRHAYLERPRGHAKTFDLGTEAVTELVLGRPGQRLFCAAADEDQAKLLFEDVADKFRRSSVLAGSVKILRGEIVVPATGSRLRVLSSDAPSAYGLRPDWIAVDELAEWRRRELWDSLWTATGKRPGCRMLVISTAGVPGISEIAWEVREIARQETDWYFAARGRTATWISTAWLAQQKRTLPAHVYARLHESRWVEGAGAWLTVEEVDGIFGTWPAVAGPVAIGLDLGVSRDNAVASVVRRDTNTGLVVVEALETWAPQGGKIELPEVEADVMALAQRFDAPLVTDPWQGVLLAQRLTQKGVRVMEYPFTADSRRRLFTTLLDLIRSHRLRARPHEALRRELLGLEVEETAAGWRVDHRSGQHDDHVMATALAAQQVAGGGGPVEGAEIIVGETRGVAPSWASFEVKYDGGGSPW